MKRIMKYRISSPAANGILFALLPALAFILLELYSHAPWEDLTLPIFLVNLLFFYLLYGICTFVFGNTSLGYRVAPLLPMIFGLVNYYVVEFRSSPILPWDFYSLGTAMSVAGNYEITVNGQVLAVTAGFIAISILGSKTGIRIKDLRARLIGIAAAVLAMLGYVQALGSDALINAVGLDTTLFTPNVLYRNNGLMVGFLGNLKYLKVEKPDGYSAEKAEEIAQEYQTLEETEKAGDDGESESASSDTVSAQETKHPNIIVIMNEAFSDLSVYGDFETDNDYMPFIHSLEENTVKGNLYVSVKGGNTANTEYEFLTGDSMAFLPAGSVPYQQYIKGEMPSLASWLDSLGYETAALHPYNASGWARNKVYPWLGFESTYFKSDFENTEKIRSYVSDESAFQELIRLYEEKEEGSSLFAFEVTMQNHGGYSKTVDEVEATVHLTDAENSSSLQIRSAEEYLTLIQKSDEAFEMLVDYFAEQDEDTIILMFGDHQPSDYVTNAILKILGLDRDGDDADEVFFDSYVVPFVMWANFDIEEEEIPAVSANYLSGILLEKAGISQTGYQEFLEEMRKEVPVVTANMIITADGTRYRYDDGEALAKDWLSSYHTLDYNHLEDTGNRLTDFFG